MKNKKYPSPLKSIRKYCIWCCNGQFSEIKLCGSGCPLGPFRMGKKTIPGSLMKPIKERCLDCGEGTAQAVRKCEFPDCDLFPYRNGKNPNYDSTTRAFPKKAL